MKNIEWFKLDGSGVAVHEEDENCLLYGDPVPDLVMIPENSPLRAGERLRVVGHTSTACPQCQRVVRVLTLEHGFFVAECQPGGCGFVFYRPRPAL